MGFWSSISSAVSSAATSVAANFQEYKKYGSVYRVLEINSSEADRSLGIGENLVNSLRGLPDVNAHQFLEEPLNNIFILYGDQKELSYEKDYLNNYKEHLDTYETLLNQGDASQKSNIQAMEAVIDEYQTRIINREDKIKNNPINEFFDL